MTVEVNVEHKVIDLSVENLRVDPAAQEFQREKIQERNSIRRAMS